MFPRLALLALLVAACAGAPPSPSPTAVPTPVVTPDPHLDDPATAQEVFNGLGRAGLQITPNTASTGPKDGDVVTRIFATYLGWPLVVAEYRSSAALGKVVTWEAGEDPGHGEHPIALAGGNVLVTWGPASSGAKPSLPDERQTMGLTDLVAALDKLLSPLRARTNTAVKITPPVASAPTSPATKPGPKATPAP
ncbi:MAG: hypothetical protein ACTS8Z_00685 [Candidatus Limnocylindrales bacterium]